MPLKKPTRKGIRSGKKNTCVFQLSTLVAQFIQGCFSPSTQPPSLSSPVSIFKTFFAACPSMLLPVVFQNPLLIWWFGLVVFGVEPLVPVGVKGKHNDQTANPNHRRGELIVCRLLVIISCGCLLQIAQMLAASTLAQYFPAEAIRLLHASCHRKEYYCPCCSSHPAPRAAPSALPFAGQSVFCRCFVPSLLVFCQIGTERLSLPCFTPS